MGSVNIALGAGQQYLQGRQNKQQQEQEFRNIFIKAQIENMIKQAQAKKMMEFLQGIMGGQGQGQGGQQGMGIAPYYNQQGQDIGNAPQIPRYRMKPTLSLTGGGDLGMSFTQEETPEFQQQMAGEKTKQTKLAEIDATMQPARNILAELKTNYFKAFPTAPEQGAKRFQYGAGKSWEAFKQTNPDVASYLQTRQAFLSLLVRGLGERGVLTNIDIKRVEQAIPSQWTTKSVAERNFKVIDDILSAATSRYVNQGGNIQDIQGAYNNANTQQPIQNNQSIPNFNPQFEKLQQNKKTGEYRVVPKNAR